MKNHLHNDIWLYRIVVAVLGLTVVASLAGAIVLTLSGHSTPEVIDRCTGFSSDRRLSRLVGSLPF